MSGRLILLGIDGASYEVIAKWAAKGILPNIQRIIQGGVFRKMTSSLPEVSPVAWHSIITGANPAEHGTFGFTDLAPHTYRTIFNGLGTLAVTPLWERDDSGRSVVINMPFTYPVRPMQGVHIAGYVALNLEKATYPPEILPELQRLGYRTDVDSRKAHQSLTLFLNDLEQVLESRIKTYRYLWENEDWQNFILVFTGTDRLSHFLWDACLDPEHPHHEAFIEHFQQVDAVVGEITDRMRADDLLVVVSDHGFERSRQDICVNAVLREAGLLQFTTDSPKRLKEIAPTSCAFALEPSRLYVHAKDKYPQGSVDEGARAAVLQEMIALFGELTYKGERVIQRVFSKHEIYHGPLLERAPDLILLAAPGFNLRGGFKSCRIFSDDFIFTGKHAWDNAILLVYGDFDASLVPEQPNVTNVIEIIDQIHNRS